MFLMHLEKSIIKNTVMDLGLGMKNQTPLILCLIGGFLLYSVHYTNGINSILTIWLFLNSLAALAPYMIIINVVFFTLLVIAWFGGIAVAVGGVLLTTSFVRLGKIIIAIAAGFGLLSLILVVLWVILIQGWAALLVLAWLILTTPWAFGLVLTILARHMAK